MSVLLGEIAGNLTVQEMDQKPSILAALQGSSLLAKTRHQINRVSRAELADNFLRLRDEHLVLKELTQKQENKIKRMGTKLSKLSHDRAQESRNRRPGSFIQNPVRNLDLEEGLEEMQGRVWDLERLNQRLRSHLLFYKQQLQLQGCSHHCPYGHIAAKVNTGVRRPHTSPRQGPKKTHKEMQISRMTVRPISPRYADDVLERSQAETEKLTHSLVLAELDKENELLSFTPDKEIDLEYIHTQKSYLNMQEYRKNSLIDSNVFLSLNRAAIQKNVELIRLQKLLWEKNSELVISKAQITVLHESQDSLRSASTALLAQLDDLNANLKEKTQKVTMLESQLEILSPLRGTLDEFQERIQDLEAERDSLKVDYDRLLDSYINAPPQNLDQVPQKDNGSSLEDQLNSALADKEILEEQLKKEKAQNDALKQEVDSFQGRVVILESQAREETPQSNPTQPSPTQPNSTTQSLPVDIPERDQEKMEIFIQDSLKRQLHEAEAAHAETVFELEKTRNMVILQHRINRDYQVELEKVLTQSRLDKQEHEEQQKQMDQLLDLRNARIHQLEEKLKGVAYGTRAVRLRPPDSDVDDEGVPSKVLRLQHGENLFELHISGAILSAEAIQLLGDPEPLTFCTYAFYDFETHCTPLASGVRPHYDFTSQYVVRVDPFFMQYLQGATSRLDLHLASAVDHTTLASCWLHFGQVLNRREQVRCTAVLRGPKGEDYGCLEYGLKLHFPFKQISQLPHPQSQTLTHLSAGAGTPAVAPQSWQLQGDRKIEAGSRNELYIQIKSCANLRSRWIGSQPSPYAMYQFFTFPDHDTPITPESNHPNFEDVKKFTLHITPELHHYLLVESLCVYVFDDEEEEPGSYLGKAQIPLVPLAHGHGIKGDFDLMDPTGKPNGSIHLSLEWKALYIPPEDVRYKAIQARSLEMQIADEQNLLHRQVTEKHLQKSRRIKNELELLSAQVIPTRELKRRRIKKKVVKTIPKMEVEEKIEEEEEEQATPNVEETAKMAEHRELDEESILESGLKDTDGEEQETSESQTTESDEVVVGLPTLQGYPDLQPSLVRVEVISLGLLPESWPAADETIQQLYIEFHFPGVPLEETETAFSLRKPRGTEEIYFHFSKVIKLDADPGSFQRQMLLSMLVAEDPEWNKLQFIVVSEPLPGASGECEDVGFSSVDLREILLTGNDIIEQDLQVLSSLDHVTKIGNLKVSVEAAAALCTIYRTGEWPAGETEEG
ncbi:X-linked retinitis pigmentosa GTPase regulator-interacting protein 1 [Thamnophis elegans]|uniref:X-linked retinitis pigmentosa GTPase regulator-interacting protein 1 n=1 Tax=Thamnophis elegans TaxID=35005 RepID=UPI0013783D02|nr:X-linked retinitis pigmentosa GTPase regulator-interacting protein 1 [Thamnophis elegans]